ncbi:MAG: hypothetical protein WCC37_05265 [Candidatus Sulfotelmatobacter sp.]
MRQFGPTPSNVMQNVIARRPRWPVMVLVVVLLGAASISISAIRRPILRAAGWALVVNERVEGADVIVLASNADFAGMLEAADLVHSGVATRVAVFPDPPDTVDLEFIRRGIPYEDAAARSVRYLRALGVDTIDQIPKKVAGTEDEGRVLPEWCDQQGFRSIVVVSTSDHSRRLRRVLHRSMKGHLARVTVRSARYSLFDPDRWWESRGGIRTDIEELEKLLLDVVRHPIS